MFTHSNHDKIYLGTKAGESLLRDIKNAKHQVKIISPYLSPGYIKELVHLSNEGVKIKLITSDKLEEREGTFTHRDLIKQIRTTDDRAKNKRKKGLLFSIISYLLLGVYPFIPIETIAIVGISILSAGISSLSVVYFFKIRIYTYRYKSLFGIRVFFSEWNRIVKGKFTVHSKVYVIDKRVAYVGSVNFTYSGIKKNYEVNVKVEDKEAVNRLSREIDFLFDSEKLPSMPLDLWGKMLYLEPPH